MRSGDQKFLNIPLTNNIMKKVLTLFLSLLLLSSCVDYDIINTYNYRVVDTLSIKRDIFTMVSGYRVIVQIDTSYYAASLDGTKHLSRLGMKLNHIKAK